MDRSGRQLYVPDSHSYSIQSDPADGEGPGSTQEKPEPRLGVLNLLNFVYQWGIPSVDLNRPGVRHNKEAIVDRRLAYTLGVGHTATVIRHEAGTEAQNIVPEGTSIAVKSFTQRSTAKTIANRANAQSTAQSQTYQAILQELAVLCHPNLSEHPNIVKLLFVGWQEQSLFPLLGLELGDYGSLDYILRAPGTGLSEVQKTHVSLDISLGLNALHENGFVHGDLKPDNVLIFHNPDPYHPTIAKLADFGGVRPAWIGEAPGFVTLLWCAPEVVNNDTDIDWYKNDVYSFGLILASIWCRPKQYEVEGPRSSCILSSFVPKGLSDDIQQELIWTMKRATMNNPDGALFSIVKCLPDTQEEFPAETLRASLAPDFWLRPSMSDIISRYLEQVGSKLGRDIGKERSFEPYQRRLVENKYKHLEVWSDSFRERSEAFKRNVLHELVAEVGSEPVDFDHTDEDIPEYLDEDISADEYLELLRQGVERWAKSLPQTRNNDWSSLDVMDRSRLCYHISFCHLLHIGTPFSLPKAMGWCWPAALGFHRYAMAVAPVLYHHYSAHSAPLQQQRLLLSLGCLSRNLHCMEIIAFRWPRHYQALIQVIQQRWHTPSHLYIDEQSMIVHPLDIVALYKDQSLGLEPGIIDKILSYDLEHVRRLLEAGADAGVVSDQGIGALHALSYLRDTDAVNLLTILVDNGASLSAAWPDSPDSYTFSGRKLSGTPLFCAIVCNQVHTARELIKLHIDHKVKVKDYITTLTLTVNFWFYELVEALLDLFETHPFLCDTTLPEHVTRPSELALLSTAIDSSDFISVERRVCHGKLYDKAHTKTLKLLISRGADPTKGYYNDCPLYTCLTNDDAISLRIFMRYLCEQYGGDPSTRLNDPGHLKGSSSRSRQHLTGMQICIDAKSTECFHILLNEFPGLMDHQNAKGMTALHLAAEHAANMPFLQALLERGADVFAVDSDTTPPLFRALLTNNTEGADLILKYCSPGQRRDLLSRQLDTGHSLFSRLIDTWLIGRDAQLLNSFRWLVDHGGAHFYGSLCTVNGATVQVPAWNELFATVRPSSRSWQLQDLALATLFLDTFAERINVQQQDGHALLHVAVWFGHVEIVRALLLKGADVNLEFGVGVSASQKHVFTGRTALEISICRQKPTHVPEIIRRGGYDEVGSWRADCEAITRILREAGGRPGSGATMNDNPETLDPDGANITVSSSFNRRPLEQDKAWKGVWPRELPRDTCSKPDPGEKTLFANTGGLFLNPLAICEELTTAHAEKRLGDGNRSRFRIQANETRQMWQLSIGWEARGVEGSK